MINPDLQSLARQWGASAIPFDQTTWLDTPELLRLRRHLDHAAALRTPLLLCGPNGVGKSALVGHWMRALDTRVHLPLALTHASLSGSSLLAWLVQRLGKASSFRREGNLQRLETALRELERRSLVLILDDAQNYAPSALEEIRLLLGLNLPEQPLFTLLLLGDDYLLGTLRLRHQRALYSRLGAHHRVEPWAQSRCLEYMESALRAVGLSATVLAPAAGERLAAASGGLPRSLQLLARAAWLAAATSERQQILTEDVQRALDQVPCVPGLNTPEPAHESAA